MNYSLDYEGLYSDISSKLKKHSIYKRMFKKPNYSEASESFNKLVKLMNEEECPEYAGVFYLSKARCDAASKDPLDLTNDLILAAENFFKVERKFKLMNITNVEDFLECGIMCYIYSINLLIENKNFNIALSNGLHLVSVLKEFGKFNDVINVYNNLSSITKIDIATKVNLLIDKCFCQIKNRNFYLALEDCNMALNLIKESNENPLHGIFCDYLETLEVYRVLLILKIEKYRKYPDMLEDYSIDKISVRYSNGNCPILYQINQQLFYHLAGFVQSILESCLYAAESIMNQLQSCLNETQYDLAYEIINELINPQGDAF